MLAERERRKRERGKKRFEQDYSFVNEEFFNSWQNRTNTSGAASSIEQAFNGRDHSVDVEVTFDEVMQEGGVIKTVSVDLDVICPSCNGTRERAGSTSLPCYSCKGTGVKKDALFNKETKCNTCKGHGKLVQNKCHECAGEGLVTKTV